MKQHRHADHFALHGFALHFAGAKQPLFDDLSLTFDLRGWTCLLGASGCGKTSLLKALAGILPPNANTGGELSHPFAGPLAANIAYLAQHDSLLPWLNVLDNVLLPLRFSPPSQRPYHADGAATSARTCREEWREQAFTLLAQVGLSGQAKAYPATLSGGQRQRVALARTLIQAKPVVLMDEPFSALDAVTRYRLQELAFELLAGKTALLVTHDPLEAIRLASRLYVLPGSPHAAHSLALPTTPRPRSLGSDSGALHSQILCMLEAGQ